MTLTRRLHDAAMERARGDGEFFDDCVLDADGVIDLRALGLENDIGPTARPAAALLGTRGRMANAGQVDELYSKDRDEHRWSLRKQRSRNRHVTKPEAPAPVPAAASPSSMPITRLSAVPLREESGPWLEITTAEPMADPMRQEPDISIAGVDEKGRTIRPCPECGTPARVDLFDCFSQIEFLSCDVCPHMWQERHSS